MTLLKFCVRLYFADTINFYECHTLLVYPSWGVQCLGIGSHFDLHFSIVTSNIERFVSKSIIQERQGIREAWSFILTVNLR